MVSERGNIKLNRLDFSERFFLKLDCKAKMFLMI